MHLSKRTINASRLAAALAASVVVAIGCTRTPNDAASSAPEVSTAAPATETKARDAEAAVALVNGRTVTAAELDARLNADAEMREEIAGAPPDVVYMGRHATLERMIDDIVLEDEARRRGTSRAALETVLTAGVALTDEETDRALQRAKLYKSGGKSADFMLERRTKWLLAGSDAEARERVGAFVLREKKRMAIRTFVLPLRKNAQIEVKLEKPPKAPAGAAG